MAITYENILKVLNIYYNEFSSEFIGFLPMRSVCIICLFSISATELTNTSYWNYTAGRNMPRLLQALMVIIWYLIIVKKPSRKLRNVSKVWLLNSESHYNGTGKIVQYLVIDLWGIPALPNR
ncbi:MAG: hypothetical protein ABIN91_02565 [Mucilaginibacter sp.]|uniref:hypothetical protein n=1 Tax=Mucilaginibacter sp. TaxID=1882438 RepID=UPI0032673781